MLCLLFVLMSQTKPVSVVSLPFIKADTVCRNKQNESDKTLFTIRCLEFMQKNYKPVKVFQAMYNKDGKEDLVLIGNASCIYITKDIIFARCELDVKLDQRIDDFVLNAKTYAGKEDYDFSDNCIFTINRAEIKHFVLRPKQKAIIFD